MSHRETPMELYSLLIRPVSKRAVLVQIWVASLLCCPRAIGGVVSGSEAGLVIGPVAGRCFLAEGILEQIGARAALGVDAFGEAASRQPRPAGRRQPYPRPAADALGPEWSVRDQMFYPTQHSG